MKSVDKPWDMTQRQLERRKEARRGMNLPNGIEIRLSKSDGPARAIMAKLVDASPGGVGVETFISLKEGAEVVVRANLHATGLALLFNGEGLVAHSREVGPGRFIVGLKLKQMSYVRAS